jgi:hypothetical protein
MNHSRYKKMVYPEATLPFFPIDLRCRWCIGWGEKWNNEGGGYEPCFKCQGQGIVPIPLCELNNE